MPDVPVGGGIETMAPLEPSVVVPQAQAAAPEAGLQVALLALLRDRVGPIADFIWTTELCEAAQHDPAFLRTQLQNSSVPVAVIDELLAKAATLSAQLSASEGEALSVPAPNTAPLPVSRAEEESAAPAVLEDDQLRAYLTELIGPIGLTVFEQVRDVSKTDQPRAVLEALRRYGVDEALLDELALRFGLTR